MISVLKWLLKLWLRGVDPTSLKTIDLVMNTAATHRILVTLVFVLNIITALFEGGSMIILAMAVATIVEPESVSLGTSLGVVGEFVEQFRGTMGRESFFMALIAIGIGGQLMRSGLQYLGSAASAYLGVRVKGDLQRKTIHKIFSLSYSEIGKYSTGGLSAYVGQAGQAAGLIGQMSGLLTNILMTVSYVAVLIWVSWKMTFGALILVALFTLMLNKVVRPLEAIGTRTVRAGIAMSKRMVGFIHASRLVHVFGREEYATRRIITALEEGMVASRQGVLLKSSIGPILESLTIIMAALFLLGGYFMTSGEQTSVLSGMLAFILVLNRMMPKVTSLNHMRASILQTLPGATKAAELFIKPSFQYKRKGGEEIDGIKDSVEFDHVTFRFGEEGGNVIDDVSFSVPAGETLAIVGQSGAGKTTMVDLLLGLYSPRSGRVLVDGKDLAEINLTSWRERIGVVDQDVFLLNATIRDNIQFGKLDATEEEIVMAARSAHAEEFILNTPDGYDTVVGERGFGLSGGQKQRLAFARAIVRSPRLLILDEATSALDSESERLIQQTVREQSGQRTVIIIAHRLSTLAHADQIIVLDSGSLVERGDHETLIRKSGIYSRLWRLQSKVERNERKLA
jgi:ATP-binding cassette subfamily B protein/subfamily B ATP-binding cassette protein MsbA